MVNAIMTLQGEKDYEKDNISDRVYDFSHHEYRS